VQVGAADAGNVDLDDRVARIGDGRIGDGVEAELLDVDERDRSHGAGQSTPDWPARATRLRPGRLANPPALPYCSGSTLSGA